MDRIPEPHPYRHAHTFSGLFQRFQTQPGCFVGAGTEGHAGRSRHDRLFLRLFPAGFDQQMPAYGNRFEKLFPVLSPALFIHFAY